MGEHKTNVLGRTLFELWERTKKKSEVGLRAGRFHIHPSSCVFLYTNVLFFFSIFFLFLVGVVVLCCVVSCWVVMCCVVFACLFLSWPVLCCCVLSCLAPSPTSCDADFASAASFASKLCCCRVCLAFFDLLFLSSCFALAFCIRRAKRRTS